MTTIALWKNNPMMWRWFWDITAFNEYLLFNAKEKNMFAGVYISSTVH